MSAETWLSHIHTWSRWRRPVLARDSTNAVVIGTHWTELSGTDRPVTPGWTRTCRTCRTEERS